MRTNIHTKKEFNALKKQASSLKAGFDKISDPAIITDEDGVILYANAASEKTSGFSLKEIVGKTPGELWGNQMAREFYRRMWKTIKKQKLPFAAVVRNKKKDGKEYFSELRIYPVFIRKKIISFFIAISMDATDKIKSEEARDKLIAAISHQLKSPVSASLLYLSVLANGGRGLSVAQKRAVKKLKEINAGIGTLLQEFFSLYEAENRGLVPEKTRVDAVGLISAVIKSVKPFADIKKIKMIFAHSRNSSLLTNEGLAGQILKNVFLNAVEYGSDGSKIEITLKSKRNVAVISCRDYGPGIAKRDYGKIFTPFFRVESTPPANPTGSGLGLYIAKKFADSLGCKIWFKSKQGKGTSFYIKIPA